jgi:secondary thiamine-phosphate synthase enzyme
MAVITASIQINTQGDGDIHDITNDVARGLVQSGLQNGIITIFCPSATSAITTIEFETGCLTDFKRLFDEIIDPNRFYAHNARWGDGNGHSHIRSSLLGPSLTVPFSEGRMTLGTWQQIILIDFDNRPRQRKLVVQLMGE